MRKRLTHPTPTSSTSQRFPLRRSQKAAAQSLPTVPSEDAKDEMELILPEQSADFDFRDLQQRYLTALIAEGQNDGTSLYAPQYQFPTVKHGGGSVMVWGCFSDTSMGSLKRIQDNDPKHTSGHVANWFRCRRVDLLEWPSQSPDLNPIEHMWKELERRLNGFRASNANQKFAQLEAALKSIPMTVVQTLLDSMSRRCQAVIDAKDTQQSIK
uniref:DDE_3 domain-containing protein n=1 Tax=Caenorhabditis japonica TaxID=281687 RepID=A0A8R1HZC4_CAEJA